MGGTVSASGVGGTVSACSVSGAVPACMCHSVRTAMSPAADSAMSPAVPDSTMSVTDVGVTAESHRRAYNQHQRAQDRAHQVNLSDQRHRHFGFPPHQSVPSLPLFGVS